MKFHIPPKKQTPINQLGKNNSKLDFGSENMSQWPLGYKLIRETGASVEKTIKPPEKKTRGSDWL